MTDENERLDPEEIGEMASTPFKTEIERKLVIDDDGTKWEIPVETRKSMTPSGEIISDKRAVVSRFVSCGHQVTDPRHVMRCVYGGHFVCQNCITQCDGDGELVCLQHSAEYEYEQQILNLCQKCGEDFEFEMRKQNTPTKKVLRLIKSILIKEEQ